MCGIYGFNFEDKTLADKMDKALMHRGPDGKGIYVDFGITLGHRRLAIIDLSEKGKQPMTNEDGTIVISYNGEIYNYLELRQTLEKKGYKFLSDSDTEVIIHSYEEWGENCVKKFNGMFAFCIYDKNKKTLFIARDHIGIKPLYYYFENEKFIFASEIKAILEDKYIKREINIEALNQYISLRYNPLLQTLFEGIKKLPPASTLKFDLRNKTFKINKFWDLKLKEEKKSENYYLKKLDKLFIDAVKRQLISDVPLGVFLSGGIDSTLVTSYMRKANPDTKIKSFSVGFEDGENVDERGYARKVSEVIGTDHKEYVVPKDIMKILPKIVYHTDEPMADPALMPLHFLSEKASKDVTVVLTGDGGDELFLGYNHYMHLIRAEKISKLPASHIMSKTAINIIPQKFFNIFYKHASEMDKDALKRIPLVIKDIKKNKSKAYYDLLSIFSENERKELLEEYKEIDYKKINNEYFKSKSMLKSLNYFDTQKLLPESFLMKTDRMTMANSIEARVPILDYRIAETAFSMPVELRMGKTPLKKLLLKDFSKEFIYRRKQPFHVPLNRWFKNNKDLIKNYDITKNKHFDRLQVEKIIEKTKKGNLYSTRQYFNIMVFDMWEKRFVE